jgi:hypothetical protein
MAATPLDKINEATLRYIAGDSCNCADEFDDWTRQVRREAGIIDNPIEHSRECRRGALLDSVFGSSPLIQYMKQSSKPPRK